MANDFFNKSNAPATGSSLSSATQRAEFAAIEQGFDKLPTLTAHGDEVVMVNSGATALTTKTKAAVIGEATTAAASKTTPVDADEVPISDSAASFALKKLTWANLKAAIKTYYDSVTATLTNKTLTAPDINGGTIGGVTIDGNVTSTGNPSLNLGTGALTAGVLTSTATGQFLTATAASAGDKYGTISNNNGSLDFGVISAGDGFIGTSTADNLRLQVAGAPIATFSSTGLSVSGGVSATQSSSGVDSVTLVNSAQSVSQTFNSGSANVGARNWQVVTNYNSFGDFVWRVGANQGAAPSITVATFSTSGNLGLGVTPSASWDAARKALQFSATSALVGSASNTVLSDNWYHDGTNSRYLSTAALSTYQQTMGAHRWNSAPSGGIGSIATLITQVLAVEKDKSLALQGATSQTGAGISFPATQVASSDANTLDDYREATYTATATGMTTSPTGTVTFVRVGNTVTMEIPAIGGTSNATTFTLTGGPTTMRPSAARYVPVRVRDNGVAVAYHALAIIGTDGVITVYKDATGAAFTASGQKDVFISDFSYVI